MHPFQQFLLFGSPAGFPPLLFLERLLPFRQTLLFLRQFPKLRGQVGVFHIRKNLFQQEIFFGGQILQLLPDFQQARAVRSVPASRQKRQFHRAFDNLLTVCGVLVQAVKDAVLQSRFIHCGGIMAELFPELQP